MRVVLLVEGDAEKYLQPFLKRWLDAQNLTQPVGLHVVAFQGNGQYLRDVGQRTNRHLSEPDTLAVFGLLDLYGLPIKFPLDVFDISAKVAFARQYVEDRVLAGDRARFHQHFAVHELEAWLLSDGSLFPSVVLPAQCARPEEVNFDTPPARLLDQLHSRGGGRGYKKVTMARNLFPRLDPAVVYQKCPYFGRMMDDMLTVAQAANR